MILKLSKIIIFLVLVLLLMSTELDRCLRIDSTASFYSDKFIGRRTALGERFDQEKYTAANNQLPLGTQVKVTRIKNQDTYSVVVRINDRTAKKFSERIDLSKAAAKKLNLLRDGVAPVQIEVL